MSAKEECDGVSGGNQISRLKTWLAFVMEVDRKISGLAIADIFIFQPFGSNHENQEEVGNGRHRWMQHLK